jgi:hypothetical protein
LGIDILHRGFSRMLYLPQDYWIPADVDVLHVTTRPYSHRTNQIRNVPGAGPPARRIHGDRTRDARCRIPELGRTRDGPKNFLHGLSGDEEVGYKNLSNKSIQPAGSLMFCLRARLHRLRKNSVLLKGTASSVP